MKKYLCLLALLLLIPAIYVYATDGVSTVEHPAEVNSVATPDKVCGVSGLAAAGAWQTAFTFVKDADEGSGQSDKNIRDILAADVSSYSGTKIRVTIAAESSNAATLVGCSIGLMTSNDDFDGAPTRITFDTGNNGATIAAGTDKLSDEITFTFTKTSRYGIHLYYSVFYCSTDWISPGCYYHNSVGSDDTLTQTISYSTSAAVDGVAKVEVFSTE